MGSEISSTGTYDRYRQLLDAAPDAMIVVDGDGIITFANLETERMFGYSRDEIVGQSVEILIPLRFRPVHAAHVHSFFDQPTRRPMGSRLGPGKGRVDRISHETAARGSTGSRRRDLPSM